jgi:two-component system response regulator MprA
MKLVAVRILVVDDDRAVRESLRRSLSFNGYSVSLAEDGVEALEMISADRPDALVLDVMMPKLDGLEVCRQLRSTGDDLPILVLTARDTISERVAGLDAGADDYLPKPFAIPELVARVKALLRRSAQVREVGAGLAATERIGDVLQFEDLTVDAAGRTATRGQRPVILTAREFDLLALFMRHPNQVLTHQQLMHRVWGDDFFGESNVLAVTIGAVRRALEEGGEPRLIQTVRGVGYVLRSQP